MTRSHQNYHSIAPLLGDNALPKDTAFPPRPHGTANKRPEASQVALQSHHVVASKLLPLPLKALPGS